MLSRGRAQQSPFPLVPVVHMSTCLQGGLCSLNVPEKKTGLQTFKDRWMAPRELIKVRTPQIPQIQGSGWRWEGGRGNRVGLRGVLLSWKRLKSIFLLCRTLCVESCYVELGL